MKQKAIKEAYDFVRAKLSPAEQQFLNGKPFSYLTYSDVFNDKQIITVGKDEERANNCSSISRTFDWRTGTLTLKYNFDSGAFSANGEIAQEFELSRASVYGIAKYNNTWKGVRILKD